MCQAILQLALVALGSVLGVIAGNYCARRRP